MKVRRHATDGGLGRRVRVRPWAHDPGTVSLSLADQSVVPGPDEVRTWVDALSASDPQLHTIRTGALFPDAAARFAERGFTVVDTLALLRIELATEAADQPTPRTSPLRPRRHGEASLVDRAAFGDPWGNDTRDLAEIRRATPIHRARARLAPDRSLAAFAISGAASGHGYLQRLAVEPAHQGLGHGRALAVDSLAWMRARRLRHGFVNTAVDNVRALGLYESLGFERLPEQLQVMQLEWSPRSMIRVASVLVGLAAVTLVAGPAEGRKPAAQAVDADIALLDQDFAVAPNGTWRLVLDVSSIAAPLAAATTTTTTTTTVPGTTAAAPPATTATGPAPFVRIIARRPVATRAELADVLEGDDAPILDTAVVPTPTLTSVGGTTTMTVDVPTSEAVGRAGDLGLQRPGLYPVTVLVAVDGDVIASHDTFVERLADDPSPAAPMNVAIVAAPADPGPAATADELAAGREALSAIAATAAAVDGPITVAIPPVLVADLPANDPTLAAELRSSLTDDEVLALPADVLDPSSAVAAEEQATFGRELVAGEDALAEVLPSPARRSSAWLAPTPISTGAVEMLRNLGFRSLVLDPAVYNELEGGIGGFQDTTLGIEVDLGDGVGFPAMVSDATGRLLDAAARDDAASATDAAVRIMASLVTTRRELGDDLARSAVLLPPGGAVPDPDVAERVGRYVGTLPDFALAPLSAVPATTDTMIVPDAGPVVVTMPDVAGPDLSARADAIDLTRVLAASTASMLIDGDDQLSTWQGELDRLMSTGLDDEQVGAELDRIAAESEAVRQCVEVPQPFTFTLTGRSSPLRLNLRNTCTERLQVVVNPSSPKLTFPSGPERVVLDADAVTEVAIPVEARSNGTTTLEVRVLTPVFDQDVDEPIVLTARVNALTGLGQVVTGGAIVVLLSWWYQHFRRRRRIRLALRNGDVGSSATAVPVLDQLSPDAAEATARSADEAATGSLGDP